MLLEAKGVSILWLPNQEFLRIYAGVWKLEAILDRLVHVCKTFSTAKKSR